MSEKTLERIGLEKIAHRLAESVDHAAYTLDGVPKTCPIFRTEVTSTQAAIYVWFDDAVAGVLEDVQLVDKDGDVIARSGRSFTKPQGKGLYVAFKYLLEETEADSFG